MLRTFAFLYVLHAVAGYANELKVCYHSDLRAPCRSLAMPTASCHSLRDEYYTAANGNVYGSVAANFGSADAFGGCVRVYEQNGCRGKSVDVRDGLESNNDLKWRLDYGAVQSMGPCVDHAEYETAGQIVYVPASVMLCGNTEFREPCVDLILRARCTKLSTPKDATDLFSSQLRLLNNTTRSVHTRGTCIRLYANDDCTGDGPKVYPGSALHHDLTALDWNGTAASIGQCSESSEWFYDGFRVGPVPDRPVIEVDDADNPIVGYQTGHGGRVEYVDALVYRKHVRACANRHLEPSGGDQEEHLLGVLLGGPGAVRYNVIQRPAPSGQRNPAMVQVERSVRSAVLQSTGGHVRYELNPIYDYAGAISPDSVAYRLTDGERLIQQGQIPILDIRQLLLAKDVPRPDVKTAMTAVPYVGRWP